MVLNECVDRDKIINDGHHDLKLLDAISNWHELGCTGWKILPCYTTQVIFTQNMQNLRLDRQLPPNDKNVEVERRRDKAVWIISIKSFYMLNPAFSHEESVKQVIIFS
jgi:hypothetical protein